MYKNKKHLVYRPLIFVFTIIICFMSGVAAYAEDEYQIEKPDTISEAEILKILSYSYTVNQIKSGFYDEATYMGEVSTRKVIPAIEKITICSQSLIVHKFSKDTNNYLGKYKYLYPFLADGEFRGFITFAKSSDVGLQYRGIYVLDKTELDFINEHKQVGLYTTEVELTAGGKSSDLFFASIKDNSVFSMSYTRGTRRVNINYSETDSLFDVTNLNPLKDIQCTTDSTNIQYNLKNGSICYFVDNWRYITWHNKEFIVNDFFSMNSEWLKQRWVVQKNKNGTISMVSFIDTGAKLSIDNVNEFNLDFQEGTLDRYRITSFDKEGNKIYLSYDESGKLFFTKDTLDEHASWTVLTDSSQDLSANAPYVEFLDGIR